MVSRSTADVQMPSLLRKAPKWMGFRPSPRRPCPQRSNARLPILNPASGWTFFILRAPVTPEIGSTSHSVQAGPCETSLEGTRRGLRRPKHPRLSPPRTRRHPSGDQSGRYSLSAVARLTISSIQAGGICSMSDGMFQNSCQRVIFPSLIS